MNKDSVKENISTYRAFSLLLLTSIFGVLGYAVANVERLTTFKMIIGVFILLVLILSFLFLVMKYVKNIKILEALEWQMVLFWWLWAFLLWFFAWLFWLNPLKVQTKKKLESTKQGFILRISIHYIKNKQGINHFAWTLFFKNLLKNFNLFQI